MKITSRGVQKFKKYANRAELSLHEFLLFFYPPSYFTLTKQWIRDAFKNGEFENEILSGNQSLGNAKILVHLLNYPIKESPMVIQSYGEKIQLTDPVGTIHVLEQNQLRNFIKRLDSY